MDLNVKNGQGSTTENAKYGESVSAVVEANEGYDSPKIECTNNQEPTLENNRLTIEKLTDNTTCTVTFNKVKETKYKLTINVSEGVLKLFLKLFSKFWPLILSKPSTLSVIYELSMLLDSFNSSI